MASLCHGKKTLIKHRTSSLAAVMLLGLLSGPMNIVPASAQSSSSTAPTNNASTQFWDRQVNPNALQSDAQFDDYKFRDGETLEHLRIHYATLGTPHRSADGNIDNAVLVLHWTGADSRALLSPGYTKALFDSGRPLDANRYYLIFPDNVGHGQSSKPSDGLKAKFPNYGYGDMVDLQHKLVTETLGIKHLHAIIGMSMGGMNAWQWAETYPDMMDGVMPVVSLPIKVSGRNLLWRRMVINAIRSDPEWKNGEYSEEPRAWLFAFQIVRLMIDGVQHLQTTVPDEAAADALIAQGRQQSSQTDANDILYSFKSSKDYDPEPRLSSIKTKLFALDFSDDEFNPDVLQVLETTVPKLQQGRFVIQKGTIGSPGHLTMAYPGLWAQHVGEFMSWLGNTALNTASGK